ncbi:MAG: flavodoxin domain-containing protein, partial [Atribacterota bacterium]|nr:flavodoxin domain-containing protein [Atribacterota bacterium]
MKTAIIYASVHHQNTKKIVEVIASVISADVVDITKEKNISLVNYDVIGFASGIYFN